MDYADQMTSLQKRLKRTHAARDAAERLLDGQWQTIHAGGGAPFAHFFWGNSQVSACVTYKGNRSGQRAPGTRICRQCSVSVDRWLPPELRWQLG